MPHLLSIDAIFFTFLNYPMSYIEFFGTISCLLSVWLVAKKNILTWPIGIFSVILYCLLFLQINLYADTLEQVYYLFVSFYGWWFWNKSKDSKDAHETYTNPDDSLFKTVLFISTDCTTNYSNKAKSGRFLLRY